MKTSSNGPLNRILRALRVRRDEEGIAAIPTPYLRQYPEISRNLSRWVKEKRYCEMIRNNEEMARSVGVDRKAMASYFRHVVREDCRTWRIRLKIREAQILIQEGDYRFMREISDRTGFSDPSNFTKQFIRHSGCTPFEWAETHPKGRR